MNFHYTSQAGINPVAVYGFPARVTGWQIFNNGGSPVYVKLHDITGVPVPGEGIIFTIGVQAGLSSAESGASVHFASGIGLTIVGGLDDSNVDPVAAGLIGVDLIYEAAANPDPPFVPTSTPTGTNLCTLQDVKDWLQITNSAFDSLLSRLITACSRDFLNKTRRTDLAPSKDWADRLFTNRDYWWRGMFPSAIGDALHDPLHGRHEIYLKHYPVNSVASLVANGTALDLVSDPTDLTVAGGYWFDDSRIGEDRQKIYLIGYVFPAFLNAWDVLPNLVINYNAGYDSIPSDIQQAVIEWVSIRRGQAQLQAVNQSATGFKIGDYEQSNPISPLTLGVLEAELPTSIQRVIDYYTRPVSF